MVALAVGGVWCVPHTHFFFCCASQLLLKRRRAGCEQKRSVIIVDEEATGFTNEKMGSASVYPACCVL